MTAKAARAARDVISRPGTRWFLVALVVYATTTVIMLHPVPTRAASVFAGFDSPSADQQQYAWWLWWVKEAAIRPGGRLAHIGLLNHPAGVYHPFTITNLAVGLAALPFSLLFAPATTYNIQVMLSFVLAGLSMYWLASELTGDRRAGLVAGFIYAFFPNKTGHALAGHLPQITVCWFPLYTLFLWRAIRKPTWGNTLLVVFTLVPACLTHVMHIAYLVLPVTLAVLVIAWLEMRSALFERRRVLSLVVAFAFAGLLVAPFLLPTVAVAAQGSSYLAKPGIVKHSTDLLAFLSPSPSHPLLAPLGLIPPFAQRVLHSGEAFREGLAYAGLVAVGLALYGLVRRWRETWVWAAVAGATAMLAMGPLLKIGGELVSHRVGLHEGFVVLPYAWIQRLPVLAVGRTPGRLNETTMFAIAVLSAYGIAELGRVLTRRSRLLWLLVVVVIVAIGLEYAVIWPFPVAPAEVPEGLGGTGQAEGTGGLLHLPPTRGVNNSALYYQTSHGRPIVGGYIHRDPPEMIPWQTTLRGLGIPTPGGDAVPRPSLDARAAWLAHLDIDYVVVHVAEDKGGIESRDYIRTLLGPPTWEDDTVAVFQVLDSSPALEATRLYTFGEGWYPAELSGDTWRRWLRDDGQLHVYSVGDEVGSLQFTVDSHLEFPILDVFLGERLLDSVVVGERSTYVTRPFRLGSGMNSLWFRARGGCVSVVDDARCWANTLEPSPDDRPLPCDPATIPTSCRSVVVDHVSFEPSADVPAGDVMDVSFGDQMHLRGARVDDSDLRPGGVLTATLAWEPHAELSERHVVFVHLATGDGALVAQHDAPIVGTQLPASAWPEGTVYSYPVKLVLPGELPSGDYRVLVGVYLWPDTERLPVRSDVPGARDDLVEVAVVRVAP